MGNRPKQTFFKRKHTDVQGGNGKIPQHCYPADKLEYNHDEISPPSVRATTSKMTI